MNPQILTARQRLEYRGSRTYFLLITILVIISVVFQIISKVGIKEIMLPLVINSISIILAYSIMMSKRKASVVIIRPWFLGFLTITAPIAAKFNYGVNVSWTFAVQSINTTILLVVFLVMLYHFFRTRLFACAAIYTFVLWALFLYVAMKNGADFHFLSMENGQPVITGVITTRELYVYILSIVLAIIAYRTILVVNQYDHESVEQQNIIKKQSDAQLEMVKQVKEKMNILFKEVGLQNQLSAHFSDKMQSHLRRCPLHWKSCLVQRSL